MANKVLILSASAGAGHVRAAQALERAFQATGHGPRIAPMRESVARLARPNAARDVVRISLATSEPGRRAPLRDARRPPTRLTPERGRP